ncbi:MAG TPA: SMC-Scp complex subunit ScpB [bacterium]|nr:SMC-Scp complex subunit ScpB [bacterium]
MTENAERQMPNDELTDEPATVGDSDSTTKTPGHEEENTAAGDTSDATALAEPTPAVPESPTAEFSFPTLDSAESALNNRPSEVLSPAPASDQSTISNPESEIPAPAPLVPSPSPLPSAEVIEALLFAADAPAKLDRLAELAEVSPETARTVIDGLNASYQETGRTFRVQRVAQGFQLYTMPIYAEYVRRLYQHQYTHRLSRAALEVMAIIAYRQPVTRPEIEQLRGVDCSGPLVTLLERRLIATYGRASRPGNPFLYRTTPEFLRYFGLAGLEDLPRMEEIGEFLARRETGPDTGEPGRNETSAATASVEQFDSLAMDGGHKDAAPEDAR